MSAELELANCEVTYDRIGIDGVLASLLSKCLLRSRSRRSLPQLLSLGELPLRVLQATALISAPPRLIWKNALV